MARPHIDFLQVQNLAWALGLGDGRADAWVRTLSHDSVTGALSALVRYPAGWNRTTPEHLTVDEEIYVLDGSIEIDGLRYRTDTYAYLPAGLVRRQAASPEGAVVLTFFSGAPETKRGSGLVADRRKWIGRIDPYLGTWDPGPQGIAVDAELKAGARIKPLHRDPTTGAETFLLGFVPVWRDERILKTATDLEVYLLSGDCAQMRTGLMRSGAYAFRPAGTEFGPTGSLTPSVFLVRTSGGSYGVTEVARGVVEFRPRHSPILPAALARFAQAAPAANPAW